MGNQNIKKERDVNINFPRGLAITIATMGLGSMVYFSVPQIAAAEMIDLPPKIKANLLKGMQNNMRNLDDLMIELSEGNFNDAAKIASIRMTQGHHMWERMDSEGKPIEEIKAAQRAFSKQTPEEYKKNAHGNGKKPHVSQFVPPEFKAMGKNFHKAAAVFAKDAFGASNPPVASDYQKAFENIQQITSTCIACHDTWELK